MKAPRSPRKNPNVPDLESLDSALRVAGLVRSGRTGQFARARAHCIDRASSDELRRPIADPILAPNGVQLLQVSSWNKIPWLWHGFSTRRGGVSRAYCAEDAPGELNLGFTATDDRALVQRNRDLLVQVVTGSTETSLISLRQCHSKLVVDGSTSTGMPAKADGLITATSGLLLSVQTADCIPVLVADRKQRVVAAFHAGWRGTVDRIVESAIGKMRLEYNSQPKDLVAAIGPGVGLCCYAVGEEVFAVFESQFSYFRDLFREVYDRDEVRRKYPMLFLTQHAPGHSPIGPNQHLDLVEANRRQLLDAGVLPKAISVIGGCTQCMPELFFSHRGSKGHAGRMMSVIGVRPS